MTAKWYHWTKKTLTKNCLSSGSDSVYLQFKPTIWPQVTTQTHIKNVILRHHYVMQKNSICIETEQRYLCRILHFNGQNLMFINPPNDCATACGTYWKDPNEH